MPSKKITRSRRHGPFVAISEQMKAWSGALTAELADWPNVTTRPMFGFTAMYRGKRIFAVIPRSRGIGSPNAIAFKLENAGPRIMSRLRAEPRIQTTIMQASRWFVFELSDDTDMNDALSWLAKAYEVAKLRKDTAK